MNIKTERHGHDNWIAFDSDCDPESDGYCVGYGKTESEAIKDYKSELAENDCFDEEMWLELKNDN